MGQCNEKIASMPLEALLPCVEKTRDRRLYFV